MGNTGKPESATVQSPLHLLQVLTRTLNEHLSEACTQAQTNAQEALDKLVREQQELTEQLEQTRSTLSEDGTQDDGQPSDRHQGKLGELTERLDAVNQARNDAEGYIRQLQSDVRQTLRLAKGLERIELQATQAIDKRNSPEAAAAAKRPATRRSRSRKPAASDGTAQQNPPSPEAKS